MDLKMNSSAIDLPAACQQARENQRMEEEARYGDGDIPEIDLPKPDNVWTDVPPEFGSGERGLPLERPRKPEEE